MHFFKYDNYACLNFVRIKRYATEYSCSKVDQQANCGVFRSGIVYAEC